MARQTIDWHCTFLPRKTKVSMSAFWQTALLVKLILSLQAKNPELTVFIYKYNIINSLIFDFFILLLDDVFKTNTDDYNDEHGENVQTINADYGSDVKLVCNLPEYNNGGEINWRKIAGV